MLKSLLKSAWPGGATLSVALVTVAVGANAQATPAMPLAPRIAPYPLAQGMPIVDRMGMNVGMIAAIADSDRGSMVVVKVDGKLVSISQATLTLDGAVVRSSQTRMQTSRR